MELEDNPTPVEVFEPEARESANIEPSVIDLVKQDLKELKASKEIYIRMPGYDASGMQIKYRLPESGELTAVAKKVERTYKDTFSRNLYGAIDTIITLCEGIYVQPEGLDEPVPLDLENTGFPVRFDERLASYIGMNGTQEQSARNVLKNLFDNRDFAIINHADRLNHWLVDSKADVERDFWQGE